MDIHAARHRGEYGGDGGHGGVGQVCQGGGGAGGAHGSVGDFRGWARGRSALQRGSFRRLVHAGGLLPQKIPPEFSPSILEPDLEQ